MKTIKTLLITALLICLLATAAIAGSGIVRHGSNGPDTITGTKHSDKLYGENGPDTLRGRAGRDFLDGGSSGNDVCIGGKGRDRFVGCETVKP